MLAALIQSSLAGAAIAQTTKPAPPAQPEAAAVEGTEVEQVVVTGTFLRGTPETAAIPVEGVNLEELRNQGSPSNMDLIKGLSEIGSVAGESNRNNAFAIGAQTVNLRSLSSSRTVVVFNGRRFPEQYSASVGRFNNIAQIPNAAIGRVEVLKDGGATTYGADAVGGVVNYITRRNINGVEAQASYRYINGSDGDYDASITVGKVFDNFNIMGVLQYVHRSELDLPERDWALRPYLYNPSSWNGAGNPGAYSFASNTSTPATQLTISSTPNSNIQMSSTGIVRDPACSVLGGFAGWSATPSPVCYNQTGWRQNLVEEQNTWQAYAEANYQFSPKFKVHGEFMFYGLDIPGTPIDNAGGLVNIFPLSRAVEFWNDAAGNATVPLHTGAYVLNSAGRIATQTAGTSSAYLVSGRNPAVADFLGKLVNSDGTPVFTSAQQTAIINNGHVGLATGTWRPFGVGGNPDYDLQHNFSNQYRYTLEFSGDIGKFAGGMWDWQAAYTLNKLDYTLAYYDMSADRLQAALNGLGGANCTGRTPGANGCQYFNPFSSAIAQNAYTGAANTVTFNGTGTYAGYTAGKGLQNSQDLISWLYMPQSMLRRSDYQIFDVVLRGDLDYHLWSKDNIQLAIGGQYRELNETDDITDLGDRAINPCATAMVTNCATQSGPMVFSRAASVSGFSRDYDRTWPVEALFGEVRIPVTDKLNVQLSQRWEKFFSDLGAKDNQVVVSQAAARWQATPWLAFRGTAGETFTNANPPAPNIVSGTGSLSSQFCPSTGCGPNNAYNTNNYANTGLRPETGFNWNVGAIVEAGPFRVTADYYSIKLDDIVVGLSVTDVLNAVRIPGTAGDLNCASPLFAPNAVMDGRPFVELAPGKTCRPGSTLLSDFAGPEDAKGTINYFGGQGLQSQLFNGPSVETQGVDIGVKWSHGDVFGGDLSVDVDASFILKYDVSPFSLAGVELLPGYDAVGSQNSADGKLFTQIVNNWRGSITFNYRHGRHNFNWSTRTNSSIVPDDVNNFIARPATNANIGNANGMVLSGLSGCSQLNSPPVPDAAGTGKYGFVSGTTRGFDACQNVAVNTGEKIPATFNSDFTYRVSLPENTNLSLTVSNVFDTDPVFSRNILSYDAFSGSPLGRTFKLTVMKKWQ